MKKRFVALILAALVTCSTNVIVAFAEPDSETITTVAEGETDDIEDDSTVDTSTLEGLKKMFALTIESENKTAEELYTLGCNYENGNGVVQWYAMAMEYYKAAIEISDDEGLTETIQSAIDDLTAFKEAMVSEENSPGGQGDIFTFFRTGVTAGQQGNYELAYAIYYDDAFFFEDPLLRGIGGLGDLLRDGTGVDKDIEKAVAIYTFNAKVLGKGNGYTSLGLLYKAETGTYDGITKSIDKALEYFILSYEDENLVETDFKGPRYAADLFDSGYTKDNGDYVEPNYVTAEKYYLIAAAGNGRTFDGTACYKLGTYYEQGRDGIEKDYEKAVKYYLLAISDPNTHSTMLGIPQTYLSLGKCYENGLGVECDIDVAISYYEKAVAAAQDNLDLVNTGSDNEEMLAIKAEAESALARLTSTIDTSEYAGIYYFGSVKLTITENGTYTIERDDNAVSGVFSVEAVANKWTGKTTVTITIPSTDVAEIKELSILPEYWDGTGTIEDDRYNPTLDVNQNEVEYIVNTVKDRKSPTGYMTTISVPDDNYTNVYAYGNWAACKMELDDPSDSSSYSTKEYSPYEWENGMYYNGNMAILMTLDSNTNMWTVSLPLASGYMKAVCIANMAEIEDAESISLSDEKSFKVDYDPQKQSQSFDWTITFYDEKIAGQTDTSVNLNVNTEEGEHQVNLAVYLPKGYTPMKEYPVLYYVPGGMTSYASIFNMDKINSIFDHLIATGKMEPTIVVGIERTDNVYLVSDIVPYIDETYSTKSDAANRGLISISMGAAASTTIWLNEEQTNTFGYYAFLSGADKTTFNVSEYTQLPEEYIEKLDAATIMIGGGTLDFNMFDGDNNSASIVQLDAWMNNYGIDHSLELVGGAHTGVTWEPLIQKYCSEYLWKGTNVVSRDNKDKNNDKINNKSNNNNQDDKNSSKNNSNNDATKRNN